MSETKQRCYIKKCKREVIGTVLIKFEDKTLPPVPYNTCHMHQKVVAGLVNDVAKELKKERG